MTNEQIAQAHKLRDVDKMPYRKIASTIGIPCSTIHRTLNSEARERDRRYKVKYHEEHQEYERLYSAKWYKAHKDDVIFQEYNRFHATRWRKAHLERARKRSREYYKEHSEQWNAYWAKRRTLILGATIGNLAEIKEIYHRAKEAPKIRCYLCGDLIPKGHRHVDHIQPVSKGGAHRPSNLAVACDGCNLKKNAKLPEEIGVLL